MRLRELLTKEDKRVEETRTYQDLFSLAYVLLDAGKVTKDGGMYAAATQLIRKMTELAEIEIEVSE